MHPEELQSFKPTNKIKFVTATALFDGHDASINIMRRLLLNRGAEIIHLGHNRSAQEIVKAVMEEDAHAVALSSYQGGHVELFKYVRDLLVEHDYNHVKIFGGGGGVIVPKEIQELEAYGITKIYSPEEGQTLGLGGIIGDMLHRTDQVVPTLLKSQNQPDSVSRSLTWIEQGQALDVTAQQASVPVIGITGTGGAGKSSLTDELVGRFLLDHPELKLALLCIDPSKRKTGGALLGDRIRMNHAGHERVFVRSMATRGSGSELAQSSRDAVTLLQNSGFDLVFVETSGIGQGDAGVCELADLSIYVMTCEYGASSQLEKIDMLDFADLVAINKFERRQAPDALRDVRAQLRRTRYGGMGRADNEYPVYGTIASRFEDDGVNGLYKGLCELLAQKCQLTTLEPSTKRRYAHESSNREALIPGERLNYLGEVSQAVRAYHRETEAMIQQVHQAEALELSDTWLAAHGQSTSSALLRKGAEELWNNIDPQVRRQLAQWETLSQDYKKERFEYQVRGRGITVEPLFTSLSHSKIPKVALPAADTKAGLVRYLRSENLPGYFPFTGGLFPFRRVGEDPKRQFAGEGGPQRTNKRFHYLSEADPVKRLSTAFDSVTLYGADPDERPDIFGKVGESGVSIATLEDMKDLFAGFELTAPSTSVSMTINGPAPIILAMYLNTAIDQEIQKLKQEGQWQDSRYQEVYDQVLRSVRGTVQADILKEDQAQNTCIFSTEFALKLMADVQAYFVKKSIVNYYAVSISGYHIAEAGANPITQLAFTLANGFTYVEYYLAQGMAIDDFAANLSFFFSNGLDPEYSVIGRVARRIWAIAMRDIYHASEKSQKLKYHIQTSGRSLHAQEIDFNDIRTTLQALMALYDNCNSLHTNAYDEAITTPTEESVRRAMAIQMIINKELGTNKCENINQGSYFITELTALVEEAVLQEFERISARGGVLGAMETQYQRSKIQEESLYYESLKDSGTLPIIGVNTFQNPKVLSGDYEREEIELIRASYDEKNAQIKRLRGFQGTHGDKRTAALQKLRDTVIEGGNVFEELMQTVRYASLGDISTALYEVGGRYRRSM